MAPSGTLHLDSFLYHAAHMNSKDFASKRKRANRLAKLEQCKLEVQRDQWLSYQVTEHTQEDKSLHADVDTDLDPCINDPGEVIHPKFTTTVPLLPLDSRVSWASLLNSSIPTKMLPIMTEAEPDDPELLRANSNSHSHLRIRRPGQKDLGSDSSPPPNTNRCTVDECGDMDASPKSCGERSPKSKASKVGRGSRRSRGHRNNSKENERIEAEHKKESKGQQRRFDGTQMRVHGQDRFCYNHETEDDREAAADVLGLQSVPKNVLQTQAHCNDKQMRTKSTSLLGKGPSKQPALQQSVHGKAWMQDDMRRPASLPSLTKQRGAHARTLANSQSEELQCPICTEDLDSTDMLFDSCPCGFSLCLFCYHKIASENGTCPACRAVYVRDVSAKPAVVLPYRG